MAGVGRPPKPANERRTRHRPRRGDWTPAPGIGWQHEPFPQPPDGLLKPSRVAWETWLRAWFAAHWTPEDVPGLRQLIRLYDTVERGGVTAADRSELRRQMDAYGITPKGQQDRRWTRPKAEDQSAKPTQKGGPYAHLRVVSK